MNRRTYRIMLALALFSLAALIGTQLYWVKKALNLKEAQFDSNVTAALSSVARRLSMARMEDGRLMQPVRKIAPYHYIVLTNDILDPNMLSHMLRKEFGTRGLNRDFEYTVFDCATESLVFSDYVKFQPGKEQFVYQNVSWPTWDKETYYFGVYFPDQDGLVLSSFDIWGFSSVGILFIISFFSYAAFNMARQRRLSEIQKDFVDSMTHELKTPLSTINLAAEALGASGLTYDQNRVERYSQIIKREVFRLSSQIETVLSSAADYERKPNFKVVALDIAEVAKETQDQFALLAHSKQASIQLETSPNAMVMGDRMHLAQVLSNLVENSIKYGGEGVSILIKIATVGTQQISVSVEDTGPGIAFKDQRRMFTKFYRVRSNAQSIKGFGLGLFYVRNVVRALGGNVELWSKVGQGTRVTIFLPKARALK